MDRILLEEGDMMVSIDGLLVRGAVVVSFRGR